MFSGARGEVFMRLREFVHSGLVIVDLEPGTRRELLDMLAEKICQQIPGLDQAVLQASLWEREEKMCTGMEFGIAIPHATIPGLEKTVCLIGRLAKPLDFGTLDGSLVQIVFCLVSPKHCMATHVRLLARIARFCTIPSFIERMVQAPDSKTLYEIVIEEDDKHV
jgi:nitrogen PTS system EIIA component